MADTTRDKTIKLLKDQVTGLLARLNDLTKPAPEPDVAPRSARGTGDVTEQAAAAVAAMTVGERVEAALRAKPMTLTELVTATNSKRARVSDVLKALRVSGKVYNLGVGNSGEPRWLWVIGDKSPTPELQTVVEQIISIQPMTFPALLKATGARSGRVSGCIVKLQRERRPVMNLGNGRKAVWFLPSDKAIEELIADRKAR